MSMTETNKEKENDIIQSSLQEIDKEKDKLK